MKGEASVKNVLPSFMKGKASVKKVLATVMKEKAPGKNVLPTFMKEKAPGKKVLVSFKKGKASVKKGFPNLLKEVLHVRNGCLRALKDLPLIDFPRKKADYYNIMISGKLQHLQNSYPALTCPTWKWKQNGKCIDDLAKNLPASYRLFYCDSKPINK